jgi:hypothetical protein
MKKIEKKGAIWASLARQEQELKARRKAGSSARRAPGFSSVGLRA